MLLILTNFINCFITAIVGFYLVKIITKSEVKIFSIRTIIWLVVQAIITCFLRQSEYIQFSSFIIFIVNIIIYGQVFAITFNESIVAVAISMILMLVGDIIVTTALTFVITVEQLMKNWQIFITANILIGAVTILLLQIKKLREKIQQFYQSIKNKNTFTNILFIFLTIVLACILAYSIYKNYTFNAKYISDMTIIIILLSLILIYINNKNSYNQLTDKYDQLYTYFQTFEEQVEKEEFDRHEFKNHLAVINGLTKEKKVKDKIKEILDNNFKVEENIINQFKNLPKGGMKGLMYYKTAVAKNNKINLNVNINLKKKNILSKLTGKENSILCKLIGVYFDNAIEAAKETKKKEVLVEIYEIDNSLKIVIANTFKKGKNFDKRNEKGVTTKGKGHGKGLYFAKQLLIKNNWIKEKQEVVKGYYIQEITINKKRK